jgi:hypothetical protein
MATLKNITRVGADVRQIARLLQAKAPENHMLAYITPEEAQFLKDRGGSGMPDAETGVPTFAPVSEYYDTGNPVYDFGPEPTQTFTTPVVESSSSFVPENYYNMGEGGGSYGMQPGPYDIQPSRTFVQPYSEGQGFQADPNRLYPTPQFATTVSVPQPPPLEAPEVSKTFGERYSDLAKSLGVKEDTLARLGLAGLQVGLGARQSRMAKEESQKAKEEQQKLAAPYRQQGAELQRQAQAGELTPVGQQQLRAVQAQAAQAASARGGVGAQQTAARVEAIRNQLLQQQSDYGLKLSGIGDQILLGSIRTGLEADRYVNQLATTYYTNIARTLVGAPTVVQYGVTQ